MKTISSKKPFLLLCASVALSTAIYAQNKEYPKPEAMKPGMSEFWTPQPKVVTPGTTKSNAFISAPSDAIVLFDEKNLEQWKNGKGEAAEWNIKEGYFEVKPGSGDITTKKEFGDFQLHLEWCVPEGMQGESQGRGNSGIFLQNRYEIQILDCYKNETYVNGMTGSVYKQTAPMANAMRKQGEWNVYDIFYTAPTFREDGSYRTPPMVTVMQNGVLLQYNTIIKGTTEYVGFPKIEPHGNGPIRLQDHGNPMRFRNIWVREL